MSTEEQKDNERKEAVAAMQRAQVNMAKVLDRVEQLERALRSAADEMDRFSKLVSADSFPYRSEKSHRNAILEAAAAARKVL